MTLATDKREALVRKLTREVTFTESEPYPELRTALESLIDRIEAADADGSSVDWAAIVAEATSLRPQH